MNELVLTANDRALLAGRHGEAAAHAMAFLQRVAHAAGAGRFVGASRAHVATAYDSTPVNHDFARWVGRLNGRVRIPTTLTACAMDPCRPDDERDRAQSELISAHVAMGCEPLLSCAPYLPVRPACGEVLAWCESSAVVYANSVCGARCLPCPEFMDLCVALTGRAPEMGMLLTEERRARWRVDVSAVAKDRQGNRRFFELLGLWIGLNNTGLVPCITGVHLSPPEEYLKGLGAAAAAAGRLDLFHLAGVTPEAPDEASAFQGQAAKRQDRVTLDELETLVPLLEREAAGTVSAVCIGAPHASAAELREVLMLLDGRSVASAVQLLLTTNQAVLSKLQQDGSAEALRSAGAQLVTGRCSYYRPALAGLGANGRSRAVTPSAKWAWYARRSLDCAVAFRDLPACVDAAVSGAVQ